jgi:hypothetical protein
MALRAVPDHPKFSDLMATLNLPKFATVGALESIWHFTGRYAPQGNIGKYPDPAMKTNLVPKQVAVYRHSTPWSTEADCHLDETEARRVVANGDARRINHGRAICLRRGVELSLCSPLCNKEFVEKFAPEEYVWVAD